MFKFLIPLLVIFSSVFANTDFQIVKKFYAERPGNLAVSSKGEIFLTMHPLDNPKSKVVKISKNGDSVPFSIGTLSGYNGKMENSGIVNAIGINITKEDILWVLDMGGKVGENTVSPKLIAWDLQKNKLEKIISIPSEVLVSNSFLQDFTIDEKQKFVFIADMTIGAQEHKPAIIVLNLQTGEAKRVLQNHKLVVAEKPLMAEGKELPKFGINPIAIDPSNEWVYFGVMSEASVMRIKATDLANFSSTDSYLASKVEKYGYKPNSDGFKVDENGNVYIGDLANSEIGVLTPSGYVSYVKDVKSLSWVDGLAIGQDGFVYAVVNQLHKHKDFSGTELGKKPYTIIKFKKLNK